MSHTNRLHGYISAQAEEHDFNRQVLVAFPFDDKWPLPNIFSQPHYGGSESLISFVMAWHGNAFADKTAWEEWRNRFEYLLGHLHANEAQVEWYEEMIGSLEVYYQREKH